MESHDQKHYPHEVQKMETFTQRNQNIRLKHGMQKGEAAILTRLMKSTFGGISEFMEAKIDKADCDTLLLWSDRILTANSPKEVCH